MSILIAIRHLTTLDNQEQRFSSGERDVPLVEKQCIAGETLRVCRELARQSCLIIHSGLLRSYQTAELLGNELQYQSPLLAIPQFKERFGGHLAGLRFNELQARFPNTQKPNEFWKVEDSLSGLEPLPKFLSRIEEGLALLRSLSPVVAILVAHAGSIKGIKAILKTEDMAERKTILCEPTPQTDDIHQFTL